MSDLISRSESYMNDLIRRKDVLALFPTNDCSDKMMGLYERVLDIPIAYDVEKVVAELEEKRGEYEEAYAYYGDGEDLRISLAYNNAMDIVKGGVDNE